MTTLAHTRVHTNTLTHTSSCLCLILKWLTVLKIQLCFWPHITIMHYIFFLITNQKGFFFFCLGKRSELNCIECTLVVHFKYCMYIFIKLLADNSINDIKGHFKWLSSHLSKLLKSDLCNNVRVIVYILIKYPLNEQNCSSIKKCHYKYFSINDSQVWTEKTWKYVLFDH